MSVAVPDHKQTGHFEKLDCCRDPVYAEKLIVVTVLGGALKIVVSIILVFLRFFEVLEGLERSRRLIGRVSRSFVEIRVDVTEL